MLELGWTIAGDHVTKKPMSNLNLVMSPLNVHDQLVGMLPKHETIQAHPLTRDIVEMARLIDQQQGMPCAVRTNT